MERTAEEDALLYALRRMPAHRGVGPIDVFRALGRRGTEAEWPPVLQTPQRWVRGTEDFKRLESAASIHEATERAAELLATTDTNPRKAWKEYVFEQVRLDVAPDAPSRLDSLFAFADPLEAFDFAVGLDGCYAVFQARVDDGVPWQEVDMGAFDRVMPETPQAFFDQEAAAVAAARHYWLVDGPDAALEVLVGGGMSLTSSSPGLLVFLRRLGMVSPSAPSEPGTGP